MSRQLTIPVADTRLHAVDTPGGTPALLFLSGGFGTVRNWDRVVRRLDGRYRTVRFDARARGRSERSADYSMRAAVDDIGRVIDATGIERPILVGWSHGATIAVRYAAQQRGRVGGLVLVDGAYPIAMLDEAGRRKVRTQFRRLGWIMRILAALGRSARMSPAESADVVIEMDAVNGELGPDFAALECPTVFVVGTGAHSGATEEEMRTVRAAAAVAEESNPRVSVFATTPHKHTQILSKAPDTVVAAIDEVIGESS
jgi:pimeloyl-ACP methyl ester carboxylesterase